MLRGRGGSERGSVAIVVALAMTLLLGFAALVVDVGLNWAARAAAQTAADSAALAGAARLPGGQAAVVGAVTDYLNANVAGLTDGLPADWPLNGIEADGEVVCWTLPADPPGVGALCPDGSDAVQVITPPINVDYAFAPVLGESSNQIRALAAARIQPLALSDCMLCLLEPILPEALRVTGGGEVVVDGGVISVNSSDPLAAATVAGGGSVRASRIEIVGGVSSLVGFEPRPVTGVPPVADPFAALPTPDTLTPPPSCCSGAETVNSDRTIDQGVYESISVGGGATLTLNSGVYVLTGADGLRIGAGATVLGDEVTIYFACSTYPAPCLGPGAALDVGSNGELRVSAPATGPYAGVALFYDRGNTSPLRLGSSGTVDVSGAIYARGAKLEMSATGDLWLDSPLVLDTLDSSGTGSIAIAPRPILIR